MGWSECLPRFVAVAVVVAGLFVKKKITCTVLVVWAGLKKSGGFKLHWFYLHARK
jgi:hypothetical protein